MVKFDTSALPSGSVISNAVLMVYVKTASLSGLATSLNVHRMTGDWVESEATWRRYSTLSTWFRTGGDYDGTVLSSCAYAGITPGTWVAFQLPTNVVQGWVDAPASNFGLIIKPAMDTDIVTGVTRINMVGLAASEDGTVANRPKLILTYSAAANTKPLAAITSPAKNSLITAPDGNVVTGDAFDTDGSVTNVEFFVDGISIGQDSTAPYSVNWPVVSGGAHTLTARATDNLGASSLSGPVSVYAAWPLYRVDMDSNPGWTLGAGWGYGVPLGVDGTWGSPDPTAGATGTNVVGYNLAGGYGSMGASCATTPAFDCSSCSNTVLTFWYWLGVEYNLNDSAKVSVSTNGTTWQDVWVNPEVSDLPGGVWRKMQLNIAAVADGNPAVRVRWQMGPTSADAHFGGWNVDDVCVLGNDRNLMTDTSAISMTEGSNATFSVKLAYAPASATTVTVARASGDPGISVTNGSTLVFTTNNWNAWQTVTVASARDADTTNQVAVVRCSGPHFSIRDVSVVGFDYDCNPPATVDASDGLFLTKVALTWSSATYAEWYEVWRGTNSQPESATRIADHVAGTSYDDSQAAPGVRYCYWIKSAKTGYVSGFSPLAMGYTSLNWNYKMKIAVGGYDRGEALSNFPALVILSTNLPGFSYTQFASPTNGCDLRFVNEAEDTTAMLNYEIDTWNTNGSSLIWVQIPQLSSKCVIWAYWGASAPIDPYPSTTNGATWDPTFRGVWHLKEPAATMTIIDSSSYRYNATANSTSIALTNGVVGAGKSFPANGLSSIYSGSTSLNIGGDLTCSAWVYPRSMTNEQRLIVNNTSWIWALDPQATRPGKQGFHFTVGATLVSVADTVVSAGYWNYLAAAYSQASNSVDFYLNGNPDGTTNALAPAGSMGGTTIGKYLTGCLDEFRVESVRRSSNWVWACFQNMVSNSAFMSYSPPMSTPVSWVCPAESGSWSNAENWSPVLVPGMANDVLLATSGHTAMVANASVARTLTFSNGCDFVITSSNNAPLTIGGGVTVSDSFAYTLNLPIQLGVDQIWTVPADGVLTVTRPVGGNAGLTKAGPGLLTLLGSNTFTRTTEIDEGTLSLGNGGASGCVAGSITDNALLVFNHADIATNRTVITGVGAVTKTGTGTLILAGSNTYSGETVVDGGVLKVVSNQFVTGVITVNPGARLDLAVANAGSNSFSQATSMTVSGGGTLTISAQTPFGSYAGGAPTGFTITLGGVLEIATNKPADLYGVKVNLSGGVMTGVAGSGWYIGQCNEFVPGIDSVSNGVTSVVQVPQLVLRPYNGNTNFTFMAESGTTPGGVDLDIAGAITANPTIGGLIKDGAGVMRLRGTNTYQGVTVVSNGTLVVDGKQASGMVTVCSWATLAGAGSFGGAVTVSDWATLAPGPVNGVGTMTVSNTLAVASCAEMNFALGTVSDRVVVTGALTLGGTLEITDAGGLGAGAYTLFTYGGPLTTNDLQIGSVPDPFVAHLDLATEGQVKLVMELTPFAQWQMQNFGHWTNSLANPDLDVDGDGMSNTNEFLAGTDPNVKGSVLDLTPGTGATNGGFNVSWQCVSGKTYQVMYTPSLMDDWLEDLPDSRITATSAAPRMLYTDSTASTLTNRFYRVRVVVP